MRAGKRGKRGRGRERSSGGKETLLEVAEGVGGGERERNKERERERERERKREKARVDGEMRRGVERAARVKEIRGERERE